MKYSLFALLLVFVIFTSCSRDSSLKSGLKRMSSVPVDFRLDYVPWNLFWAC